MEIRYCSCCYSKKLGQRNRTGICEPCRKMQWAHANRDKMLGFRKKSYEKNKESHMDGMSRYRATPEGREWIKKYLRTTVSRWHHAISTAKRRKKEWNLEFDDFVGLLTKPCYYCGADLGLESGVGLDRIDNKRGYHLDNVHPCCGNCNKTRSHLWTVEETKVMIDAVMKFRREKR